jgi:hypothetical protein
MADRLDVLALVRAANAHYRLGQSEDAAALASISSSAQKLYVLSAGVIEPISY